MTADRYASLPHSPFSIIEATAFLSKLFGKQSEMVRGMRGEFLGPDGFPYVAVYPDTAGQTLDGISIKDRALNAGFGLALFQAVGDDRPLWVFRYRDILCHSIFGALKPNSRFDETRYVATLDKPLPHGTKIVEGNPSEAILPHHCRDVLVRMLSERHGKRIAIDPRLVELPEVDDLFRIKLNSGLGGLPVAERTALDAVVAWCLPYAAYL